MPDRLSGVVSGASSSLALLAVTVAVAAALGERQRAIMLQQLGSIAEDWAREDASAELQATSRRILRPALALLRASHPEAADPRPPGRRWRGRG